jgi:catechol 2,3-dioxygenase-like lactoylglutathione lyase family enzyme
MNHTPLRCVAPILSVADVDAAIACYTAVLDFQLGWRWGTPTTVASVCRDGVELMREAAPREPAAAAPSMV